MSDTRLTSAFSWSEVDASLIRGLLTAAYR